MDHIPVNPNVVPLLQGIKPFLAEEGKVVTEGILSVLHLLTSEHGKDAVATMSKIFTESGSSGKAITVNTVNGPVTFSLNLVFVLFLILILLILSGNLLALSPGLFGGADLVGDGGTKI